LDCRISIANGFMPGFLGNIGLGPLGGADLFAILIGLALVAAIFSTQWRTRAARLGYGQSVDPLPLFLLKFGAAAVILMFVVVQLARFRNLPWVLALLGVLVVGYSLITNRTVFGRHIYAIGGNLHAATLSGVKVKSVTFWIFVNMGVLARERGLPAPPRRSSPPPATAPAGWKRTMTSAPDRPVARLAALRTAGGASSWRRPDRARCPAWTSSPPGWQGRCRPRSVRRSCTATSG
jgi:ABC-type xylose transport system permease subunit